MPVRSQRSSSKYKKSKYKPNKVDALSRRLREPDADPTPGGSVAVRRTRGVMSIMVHACGHLHCADDEVCAIPDTFRIHFSERLV